MLFVAREMKGTFYESSLSNLNAMLLLSEGAAYSFRNKSNTTAQDIAIRKGWNWNEMLARANINYFDQLVTCVNVANTLPKKKKVIKPSTRKRKRDEMEEEEEQKEKKFHFLKISCWK